MLDRSLRKLRIRRFPQDVGPRQPPLNQACAQPGLPRRPRYGRYCAHASACAGRGGGRRADDEADASSARILSAEPSCCPAATTRLTHLASLVRHHRRAATESLPARSNEGQPRAACTGVLSTREPVQGRHERDYALPFCYFVSFLFIALAHDGCVVPPRQGQRAHIDSYSLPIRLL